MQRDPEGRTVATPARRERLRLDRMGNTFHLTDRHGMNGTKASGERRDGKQEMLASQA
jgi:hypothetical protein